MISWKLGISIDWSLTNRDATVSELVELLDYVGQQQQVMQLSHENPVAISNGPKEVWSNTLGLLLKGLFKGDGLQY